MITEEQLREWRETAAKGRILFAAHMSRTAVPALCDEVERLRAGATFLLNRLAELEIPDELARDWMGYVEPAIGRLKNAVGAPKPRSLGDAVKEARGGDAPIGFKGFA